MFLYTTLFFYHLNFSDVNKLATYSLFLVALIIFSLPSLIRDFFISMYLFFTPDFLKNQALKSKNVLIFKKVKFQRYHKSSLIVLDFAYAVFLASKKSVFIMFASLYLETQLILSGSRSYPSNNLSSPIDVLLRLPKYLI